MTMSGTSPPPCGPFSRSAEFYDLIHRHKNYAEESRQVRTFLNWDRSSPPRRMLDLGCGTARFSREFAAEMESIVAADPSDAMLRAAQASGPLPPNVHPFIGDVEAIRSRRVTLWNGCFDAVICMFGAMSYATANGRLVDQLRKILGLMEPGGRIVFDVVNLLCCCSDFHKHSATEHQLPDGRVLRRIMRKEMDYRESIVRIELQFGLTADPLGGVVLDGWTERHEMRAFSPREVADAMRDAGFRDITICQPPSPHDVREIYAVDPTDYYCWATGTAT